MPYTTIAEVLERIGELNCTRYVARTADGDTIDSMETDSTEVLKERVAAMARNNSGTIKVEAWEKAPAREPGQTKAQARASHRRYAWTIRGTLGQPDPAAPALPTVTDGKAGRVYTEHDLSIALSMERMKMELDLLRRDREQLIADLESDDDDDDDDEDDEDEDSTSASVLNRPLFGMSGEQTHALATRVVSILELGVTRLVTKGGGAIGAAPITRPLTAPADQGIDPQLVGAWKKLEAMAPDMAAKLKDELITMVSAQPDAEGK